MKTVSAKLTKEEHDQFLEVCNKAGETISEKLRGMIQDCCDIDKDETTVSSKTDAKPQKITISDIPDEPKATLTFID